MQRMSAVSAEQILASCAVVIERPVIWGAMDAYQHVNNTVYFRYFEDARIEYFERARLMGPVGQEASPTSSQAAGTAGSAGNADGGASAATSAAGTMIGPILAETWCRFKAPLYYPDTVRIGTRIRDIGEDRFTMEYVVISARLGRAAAEGGGIIVSYDYAAKRKAPMPAAWRTVLALPRLDAPPATTSRE